MMPSPEQPHSRFGEEYTANPRDVVGSSSPTIPNLPPPSPTGLVGGPSSMPDPGQALARYIQEGQGMQNTLMAWMQTYPACAAEARAAMQGIRQALQKIVASGSGGPNQEPPSPRMLG